MSDTTAFNSVEFGLKGADCWFIIRQLSSNRRANDATVSQTVRTGRYTVEASVSSRFWILANRNGLGSTRWMPSELESISLIHLFFLGSILIETTGVEDSYGFCRVLYKPANCFLRFSVARCKSDSTAPTLITIIAAVSILLKPSIFVRM